MKRKFVYGLIILLLLAGTAELSLRLLGFIPGLLIPRSVLPEFEMDLSASVSPSYEFIANQQGILHYNRIYFDTCTKCPNSRLYHYLKNVKTGHWGYRQITNKVADKAKRKIMLIGDSFTWGFSADPIDSSFANILANKYAYEVYNFGIPGTDPVQYAAVGRHFFDSIKPDIILVNFFIGNDFVYYPKKAIPFENTDHFTTTLLWFPKATKPDNDTLMVFPTDRDARAYFLELISFGKYSTSPLKRWLSKTCVTTFLGAIVLGTEEGKYQYQLRRKEDYTASYLREIDQFCKSQLTPCLFLVIPDKNAINDFSLYHNIADSTLRRSSHFYPATMADYMTGRDVHFNNRGHQGFAAFADSVMKMY